VTLLAAFQVLLHRHSGQDDIVVGSPAAGRNASGLSGLVGYFANPLPLRADLSGEPTFSEFLDRIRQVVIDGLEHQHFPFSEMVERLAPGRVAGASPIFQVMFILQKDQFLATGAWPRSRSTSPARG
jgi:non-ribosomal peptide synthetase component F